MGRVGREARGRGCQPEKSPSSWNPLQIPGPPLGLLTPRPPTFILQVSPCHTQEERVEMQPNGESTCFVKATVMPEAQLPRPLSEALIAENLCAPRQEQERIFQNAPLQKTGLGSGGEDLSLNLLMCSASGGKLAVPGQTPQLENHRGWSVGGLSTDITAASEPCSDPAKAALPSMPFWQQAFPKHLNVSGKGIMATQAGALWLREAWWPLNTHSPSSFSIFKGLTAYWSRWRNQTSTAAIFNR